MFDLEDMREMAGHKSVLLFTFGSAIKPNTKVGINVFIRTSNTNFQKSGYSTRFEIFYDPIFNDRSEIVGESVYLILKDKDEHFAALDISKIKNMVIEYLFHIIGLYASNWDKLNG